MKTVRFVSIIFIFASLTHAVSSHARTSEQLKSDINQAADLVVTTYQSSGMTGLVNLTTDCYDKTSNTEFFCVYIDLASRYIDQTMSEAFKFPPTEYFQDEQFGARIYEVFVKHDMGIDESNKYLQAATPAINSIVEKKLQ